MPDHLLEPATIRRMREADLHAVLVAADAAGVCAYVFAYPSRLGAVTPLNAGFAPVADAETLYIHDLAVHPRAHQRGVGRLLARSLLGAASSEGLRHGALVAMPQARPFWERLGFAATDAGEGRAVLAS